MYGKWQSMFFLFWRILASMAGKVSSTVTVFWCGHLSNRLRPSALFSHIQEARYLSFSLDKGWSSDVGKWQRKDEKQIGSEGEYPTVHGIFLISLQWANTLESSYLTPLHGYEHLLKVQWNRKFSPKVFAGGGEEEERRSTWKHGQMCCYRSSGMV